MMLPESTIYTCVDGPRKYAVHFLEGQKLIQDMALTHQLSGAGFAFFRTICLVIKPMLCLLKQGEYFGFYLNSEEPYFRLKIELTSGGAIRAMMLPEDFQEYPEKVSGTLRLNKYSAKLKSPYQSILEIHDQPLEKISEQILQYSYQMTGSVFVSKKSDQSLLVLKLPDHVTNKEEFSADNFMELQPEQKEIFHEILSQAETDTEALKEIFLKNGFDLLAQRKVFFRCNCSRERMIQNLHLYQQSDPEPLFNKQNKTLSITCEYCKNVFEISEEDLIQNPHVVN